MTVPDDRNDGRASSGDLSGHPPAKVVCELALIFYDRDLAGLFDRLRKRECGPRVLSNPARGLGRRPSYTRENGQVSIGMHRFIPKVQEPRLLACEGVELTGHIARHVLSNGPRTASRGTNQ